MLKKIKDWLTRKEEQKEKNNKLLIVILLVLAILFEILIGTSFSMYENIIKGKGIAYIAKPIIEIRRQESILITANNPNDSYAFEVRNYKETEEKKVEINEVNMEYYIEIISDKNNAIKFSLYQGDKEITLTNNKTEKIQLQKGEKQVHSYHLDISYDELKNGSNKPINQNIEIKIHSIQKS